MPRKSKKEKQEASQRKIFKLTHTREGTFGYDTSLIKEVKSEPLKAEDVTSNAEEIKSVRYFKGDLRKTLTIAAIVFALEFILYSVTMNNYLSRWISFN